MCSRSSVWGVLLAALCTVRRAIAEPLEPLEPGPSLRAGGVACGLIRHSRQHFDETIPSFNMLLLETAESLAQRLWRRSLLSDLSISLAANQLQSISFPNIPESRVAVCLFLSYTRIGWVHA